MLGFSWFQRLICHLIRAKRWFRCIKPALGTLGREVRAKHTNDEIMVVLLGKSGDADDPDEGAADADRHTASMRGIQGGVVARVGVEVPIGRAVFTSNPVRRPIVARHHTNLPREPGVVHRRTPRERGMEDPLLAEDDADRDREVVGAADLHDPGPDRPRIGVAERREIQRRFVIECPTQFISPVRHKQHCICQDMQTDAVPRCDLIEVQHRTSEAPVTLIEDLLARIPHDRVVLDPDVVAGYEHDEAEWAPYSSPEAVVRPRTAEEVQAVVQVCLRRRVPVVARGAGTGLSGGANSVAGCVVVCLDAMTAIREIDELERYAVVEPGVVNDDLRAACAEHGLWYPPDPASSPWSTIGGNVATNAGGLCCVKYGVTRDYVMGMQVVTGTGNLVRLGRRTAKGVAGYDLAGLMVGSEGTLGIVTEITVKLRPMQEPQRTIAGYFDSLVDAGRAVSAVAAAGLTPSALELIDRQCLLAVDAWKNMGLSTEANVVLLGRVDTPGAVGDQESEKMLACFDEAGASWSAVSTDQEEAEALFAARRLAYPAMERLGPVLTEDVCVPKRAVPEMLSRIEHIGAKYEITIANIAHAGDGNLHPLLITPHGDDAARTRAQAAFAEIIDAALELGGTVTGEHGVGLLKMDGLGKELDPVVMAMHHAIKDALDPHGIFNPGKVISRSR